MENEHGSEDLVVAGVPKNFTVVGVGVNPAADEVQWVPRFGEESCAPYDLGVGATERAQYVNTTVLGPYPGVAPSSMPPGIS